jgi:L-serine dehydratase
MAELISLISRHKISLGDVILANEEAGDPKKQKVGFDEVVEMMLETGRDMSTKYKETSEGGLAQVCAALC